MKVGRKLDSAQVAQLGQCFKIVPVCLSTSNKNSPLPVREKDWGPFVETFVEKLNPVNAPGTNTLKMHSVHLAQTNLADCPLDWGPFHTGLLKHKKCA